MKTTILSLAMIAALCSCKDAGNKTTETASAPAAAEPTAAAPAAEATIVGKWHVTDIKMDDHNDAASQQKMKDEMAKANMVYEFTADGNLVTSNNGAKGDASKYIKTGSMMISTNASGKADTTNIAKLTDKELNLRNEKDKATLVMEKM